MLESDKMFAGSVPENYDRYMVPLIFEPYAADMARRIASLLPGSILETAAGTGVVTRALRSEARPEARRTFPVQRVGQHRGKYIRRRRDQGARAYVSEGPAALSGPHAAWLSRYGADPTRSGIGGIFPSDDRDQGRTEPGRLGAHSGRGLLPGNAHPQRNRGQGSRQTGSCDRPCRSRDCGKTWAWRGGRQNPGAYHHGRRLAAPRRWNGEAVAAWLVVARLPG